MVVVVGWDWCHQGSQECWVAFGCRIQRCHLQQKRVGGNSQTEVGNGNCGTGMLNSSGILGKKGEPFVLTWAAGSTGAPLQYICHCRKNAPRSVPTSLPAGSSPLLQKLPGKGGAGAGSSVPAPAAAACPALQLPAAFP